MKKHAIFLLFMFQVLSMKAQSTPYHYTIQADLSTQLIYCVEQDNYGRLLVGTDKGLFRYNGFHSARINVSGNYSREITQLVKVSNDNFLAANRSGQLLQLQGNKLTAIALEGFTGDIRQVAVEGNTLTITGSKFINTYRLPDFKWINQEAIPFTEPEGTVANCVAKLRNHRFAALNSGELVEIEEGSSRNIPFSAGKLLAVFDNELIIIPARTADNMVYSYAGGRFKNWGSLSNRGNAKINTVRVIGKQLFVLTEDGVFVYTNGMSKKPARWFKGIATTDIFEDAQHNNWICTKGRGLLFIPAGRHDIVFDGSLLSIESGPNNTFFGGTLNGSILQFDERGKILKTFSSNTSNFEAQFIHFDSYAQLLFSNTGLFSIKKTESINTVNESIKGVARAEDGTIYLAKSSGTIAIPNPRNNAMIYGLKDSTKFAVLRREPSRNVLIDLKTKDLALSTVEGVFWKHDTEQLTEITFQSKPIDAQSMVWFNGDLIMANSSNELLLARDGKIIKRKDLSDKVGDLVVLKMLATGSHVYMLTEKGLYRFGNFDDKIESLRELIGFDGLVMRDFALSNDKLFIATQRGVLRFSWQQEEKVGYSLVVNDIFGRKYKKYSYKKGIIQFPFDEKLIIIPFECVDLSGNHQFIVQYAIHTTEERGVWNALPSSAEQLNLSHLSPGNYTIEFYLYDPVSQTKSEIQRKKFNVLYKWYNRPYLWWFIGLLFAFFLGLTWRWTLIRQRKMLLGDKVQ